MAAVAALLPELITLVRCDCCATIEGLAADAGEVYAFAGLPGEGWQCECTAGWMADDPLTVCPHVHAGCLELAEVERALAALTEEVNDHG